VIVTLTTKLTDMIDVLERVMRPLRLVGINPAKVGMMLSMVIRLIPLMMRQAGEILETLASAAESVVVSVALRAGGGAGLTVYRMWKSWDRARRIDAVRLLHKAGGKSGTFRAS